MYLATDTGYTYASAVLPTPGGPYISVTSPRETPTGGVGWLEVSYSLPCKNTSRLGSPVEIGRFDVEELSCSVWVAETVGRRSGDS